MILERMRRLFFPDYAHLKDELAKADIRILRLEEQIRMEREVYAYKGENAHYHVLRQLEFLQEKLSKALFVPDDVLYVVERDGVLLTICSTIEETCVIPGDTKIHRVKPTL